MNKTLKIPLENIRVGQPLWWTAERLFSSWNSPCIIMDVDDVIDQFTVLSYDDMKRTTVSWYDYEGKSEFRICTMDEVDLYIEGKILSLKKSLLDKDHEINIIKRKIEEYEDHL